jgi:hypothetical protein
MRGLTAELAIRCRPSPIIGAYMAEAIAASTVEKGSGVDSSSGPKLGFDSKITSELEPAIELEHKPSVNVTRAFSPFFLLGDS